MSYVHDSYSDSGLDPVPVRKGYAAWSEVYDSMLTGVLEEPILDRFNKHLPPSPLCVADLGCGTGRTAQWLLDHASVASIDGVDISPEMLDIARGKDIYRNLLLEDIQDCSLPHDAYSLVVNVLTACHLESIENLYATAGRLLKPNGMFWILDLHPHILLSGGGTVVPVPSGESVYIQNHIHLLSEHTQCARDHGFDFWDFHETLVAKDWGSKSSYSKFIDHPLGFGFSWEKQN